MPKENEKKEAKLHKIELNNFGPISHIELEIQGQITRLIGLNGSGKTTVTHKALAAAFRGIAEKGNKGQLISNRYQFIGNKGKSADVVVTIEDTKAKAIIEVRNHIIASKNSLSLKVVEGPDNYILDREWIYNLFDEALISARKFASLSSKEQALALGINTSEFDNNISALKLERRDVTRDIKSYGIIEIGEPIEPISVIELTRKKDALNKKESEYNKNIREKNAQREYLERAQKQVEALKKQLIEANKEVEEAALELAAIKDVPEFDYSQYDIINEQIQKAETINKQAAQYQQLIEKQTLKNNLLKKETELNSEIQKEEIKRQNYIQNFELPFENMSIDNENNLLFDNRPINYEHFSAGELEKIVSYIATTINPGLKLRIIDDFNLMDVNNQKDVLEYLTKEGFDVIVNDIGDTPKGDGSIIISSGEIIK